MANHDDNVTTIHSEEYKHLTEMVLKLKRSVEVLKQDKTLDNYAWCVRGGH